MFSKAARHQRPMPIVLYTSTNKVYGGLDHLHVVERPTRYEFENVPYGVSETCPLDFHSPYGCSKGAADQYVHDYHRIYDLRTIVFRMSCIYGPRQFGNEDQGWVAHFALTGLSGGKLTIYGDGKQVRDLLYVDDLVDLMMLGAISRIDRTAGEIYNVGGGPANTISVWVELPEKPLNKLLGQDTKSYLRSVSPKRPAGLYQRYQQSVRAFGMVTKRSEFPTDWRAWSSNGDRNGWPELRHFTPRQVAVRFPD